MKIFKLLAILGVTIVVGVKKKGGSCPEEIPEVGLDCNPDKFQTKNGKCKKCHYGRRCCCDDHECYKEMTFTCEGGEWNLNRDKCPEEKCSMCEMPYDYEKVCTEDGCIIDKCLAKRLKEAVLTDITLKDKGDESQALCKRAAKKETTWVCTEGGCIIDRCLAYHLDEDVLTDITLKDEGDESQALCKRAAKKECDQKKGKSQALCMRAIKKECDYKKGNGDHKNKHEKGDRDPKKKKKQKDNGRND